MQLDTGEFALHITATRVRYPKTYIRHLAAQLDLETLFDKIQDPNISGYRPAPSSQDGATTLHTQLLCIFWLYVTTSLTDPVARRPTFGKQSLERHRTAQWV